MSTARRSAEEWVAEDWAAVARAINQRVDELGMSQRTLAERAQVSSAIIREIQQNKIQRRRNAKTLEALSVALNWPAEYLSAVLDGRDPAEAISRQLSDVPNRLTAMERQLRTIARQLEKLNANVEAIISDDRRKR
jgi:transcriptional regulator with XRE-family HTH domain